MLIAGYRYFLKYEYTIQHISSNMNILYNINCKKKISDVFKLLSQILEEFLTEKHLPNTTACLGNGILYAFKPRQELHLYVCLCATNKHIPSWLGL